MKYENSIHHSKNFFYYLQKSFQTSGVLMSSNFSEVAGTFIFRLLLIYCLKDYIFNNHKMAMHNLHELERLESPNVSIINNSNSKK
jgi:hypothetical protein